MKTLFLSMVMALLLLTSCTNHKASLEVISFNIRLDHEGDGINQWKHRIPLVQSYLEEKKPAIIGMQEVLPNQLDDLKNIMEGYNFVAAGREDGINKGEACPVFFDKELLSLKDSGHFWLSETPEDPGSMSWGTHYPRIVTWTKLKIKENGKTLFFFNTHFSHISEEARIKSAEMLLQEIKRIAGVEPVILTGDFNTPAESGPYNTIINSADENFRLLNAEEIAETKNHGNITYNAFDPGYEGTRIDFIFVSESLKVKEHTVDEIKQDSLFISDHFPVRALLLLKRETTAIKPSNN
jgi:endonuclease/exonuclease/phosphatase family metal-dependent hydrolase